MKIYGYSLRTTTEEGPQGEIDIEELIQGYISDSLKQHIHVPTKEQINSTSHIPQKNPEKWENLMTSLVCALTGKIPSRDEIKRGRQIYEALPRNIRKSCTPEEIFGLFPYIITGFKVNLAGINRNGTNSLESTVAFTYELLSSKDPTITTFFCAHKEDREINKDTLRQNIKLPYAKRAISLLKGLIKNSKDKKGSIILHQARGNYYSMNTIFPQIFLKYLATRSLPNLARAMEQHFTDISELVIREAPEVAVEVRDVVTHYEEAEREASQRFGKNWKYIDIAAVNDLEIDKWIKSAAEDLSRLMTHTNSGEILDKYSREYIATLPDNERKAAELFEENSKMTLAGRAILDCMFFYVWGRLCKQEGFLGVGLDVDHDTHQTACFSWGYQGIAAPLLYARKNGEKDRNDDPLGLDNLSIRQFWR